MGERDGFKSRMGFLLVSAGCAIGIGNVWKFPYVTGEYGGAVFVLFYLMFLLLMGIPVMTMELAVGRASRESAVQGYKKLEKPGQKWHIHGWFCILGCLLLILHDSIRMDACVFLEIPDRRFCERSDGSRPRRLHVHAGISHRNGNFHGTYRFRRIRRLRPWPA